MLDDQEGPEAKNGDVLGLIDLPGTQLRPQTSQGAVLSVHHPKDWPGASGFPRKLGHDPGHS